MSQMAIDIVKEAKEKLGLINAAKALGHKTTNRIERWIKENEVPSTQALGVVTILIREMARSEK